LQWYEKLRPNAGIAQDISRKRIFTCRIRRGLAILIPTLSVSNIRFRI
jgi:hypothetical protein